MQNLWFRVSRIRKGTERKMKKISFVIPCYRSEHTLPHVVAEIEEKMKQLTQYTYDIFLVNDCSPDNLDGVMREYAEKSDKIRSYALLFLRIRRIINKCLCQR